MISHIRKEDPTMEEVTEIEISEEMLEEFENAKGED